MSFLDLPDDCLKEIMGWLSTSDTIRMLGVCKRFHASLFPFAKEQYNRKKDKLYEQIGIRKILMDLSSEDINDVRHVANVESWFIDFLQKLTNDEIIELWGNRFKTDNPLNELLTIIINYSSRLIQYINNPSLELQLIAVKNDGCKIKYIENPPLQVQLAAIEQSLYLIQYIKYPHIETQLAVVKKTGCYIQFIENPPLQVQLESVKKDNFSINYIKNPHIDVQMYVIKKDICYCSLIKNPHADVLLYLLSNVNNNEKVAHYLREHHKTLLKLI